MFLPFIDIPDPKLDPLIVLDSLLTVLHEMGPWGTQRAAHHFYQRNEKLKVKTPHERHYLLFCLVNTALVQVHTLCEQTFQKQLTAEEPRCTIERYSSPKVRRLLKVLRCFKPAESADGLRKMRHQVDQADFNKLSHVLKAKCHVVEQLDQQNAETVSVVRNLEQLLNLDGPAEQVAKPTPTTTEAAAETASTPSEAPPATQPVPPVKSNKNNTGQTHTRRRVHARRNNRYQHDASETLCALIYCNHNHTARVLFELLAEMSRRDPDLKFLRCQYTTDRVADPTTEPKEAEQEHRRQEEVLKRFRMHDCNVLIGTSVLEEGIDVPKCNLVVRWDPPITYRSYVQCKGRARAAPAYHVMLVAPLQEAAASDAACDPIQLSDQSHRYICAATNGDAQQAEADSDSDDSALPNSSTSDPYTFGTARGTVKILNPEVFSNQPPTSCDIKLQEIQDETPPTVPVSNLFDTGNSSDDAISLTNTTPSDRSAERRPKQRFKCELAEKDLSTPAAPASSSVDSLASTTQVLVHQMAQYREIEQVKSSLILF